MKYLKKYEAKKPLAENFIRVEKDGCLILDHGMKENWRVIWNKKKREEKFGL